MDVTFKVNQLFKGGEEEEEVELAGSQSRLLDARFY